MIKALYGRLKYDNKSDIFILIIKYFYILFTFPFLLFALLLSLRSAGVFGNGRNEQFSKVKLVLLHMSAIVISFAIWGTLWSIFVR